MYSVGEEYAVRWGNYLASQVRAKNEEWKVEINTKRGLGFLFIRLRSAMGQKNGATSNDVAPFKARNNESVP